MRRLLKMLMWFPGTVRELEQRVRMELLDQLETADLRGEETGRGMRGPGARGDLLRALLGVVPVAGESSPPLK